MYVSDDGIWGAHFAHGFPITLPTHPRSFFFSSGTRTVAWGKRRAWLGLVDLSQTPSGTFFGVPALARKWVAKIV